MNNPCYHLSLCYTVDLLLCCFVSDAVGWQSYMNIGQKSLDTVAQWTSHSLLSIIGVVWLTWIPVNTQADDKFANASEHGHSRSQIMIFICSWYQD